MAKICLKCGNRSNDNAVFCSECGNKMHDENICEQVYTETKELEEIICARCGKRGKYKVKLETGEYMWLCSACYDEYCGREEETSFNLKINWATILEVSSIILWIFITVAGFKIGETVDNINGFMDFSGDSESWGAFLGGVIGFIAGGVSISLSMAVAEILRKVSWITDKSKEE